MLEKIKEELLRCKSEGKEIYDSYYYNLFRDNTEKISKEELEDFIYFCIKHEIKHACHSILKKKLLGQNYKYLKFIYFALDNNNTDDFINSFYFSLVCLSNKKDKLLVNLKSKITKLFTKALSKNRILLGLHFFCDANIKFNGKDITIKEIEKIEDITLFEKAISENSYCFSKSAFLKLYSSISDFDKIYHLIKEDSEGYFLSYFGKTKQDSVDYLLQPDILGNTNIFKTIATCCFWNNHYRIFENLISKCNDKSFILKEAQRCCYFSTKTNFFKLLIKHDYFNLVEEVDLLIFYKTPNIEILTIILNDKRFSVNSKFEESPIKFHLKDKQKYSSEKINEIEEEFIEHCDLLFTVKEIREQTKEELPIVYNQLSKKFIDQKIRDF